MKILITPVGKIKIKELEKIALMYEKRISHYHKVEIIELKSTSDVLSKLKTGDYVIACDERGKELTSKDLSLLIDKISLSNKRIVFIIGGADGIEKNIKDKCNFIFSFSKLTFQHDLARILLLEQIYRASTISKGEPYHRE